mmetsp:Transcript_9798/g.17266  ORF Transcript_9798/g.17266 Transcript_9798/m.17266 type:complete len:128 (+) Transcript_9798:118-501(+)
MATASEAPALDKYGTHGGITCDGCAVRPITGYRWKCLNCKNHDICDGCYAAFKEGTITQAPSLARMNKVSANIEDHSFRAYSEKDSSFVGLGGVQAAAPAQKVSKKVKPNEPCPCESGKKYKKCCGK